MKSKQNQTTDEKIREAFINYLREKTLIEDITVASISEKAGISKSTFYRHYKDIYDVYEQMIDEFMGRCEKLIFKLFFEKSITMPQVIMTIMRSGIKKDNELFYVSDAILLDYSIEVGNAKVVELLYEKAYNYVVRIAKKIGADDEEAAFGAVFFLNGNIVPILLNLHSTKKIDLKTVSLTTELFEHEVEKWKMNQKK